VDYEIVDFFQPIAVYNQRAPVLQRAKVIERPIVCALNTIKQLGLMYMPENPALFSNFNP